MTKKIRLELSQLDFALLYKESTEDSLLRKILDKKIDDMLKRELYSDMLTAATDADKRESRKLYLSKIGVRDND